jgi:asparagine synthase (glutamine-hydrolysing)
VDGIALLQLARRGWPLVDRTWLESIRVAPPGTWLDITATGVAKRRYFRFHFQPDEGASSLSSYVDDFAEHVRRAMQRTAAGSERIGIPLSGGLDSRTLLLAAEQRARPLLTYTFGSADSRDVRYAAQLAHVAGVTHLQLRYSAGYLGRLLSPIVWRTEGLLPFSEVTFTSMHFHGELAGRIDAILYGHAGDALTGAHLPHRVQWWRCKDRLVEWVFRRYRRVSEPALQRVFAPAFYRRFAPALRDELFATFADIEQEELADVLDVWDLENRQRRGTFPSGVVDRSLFAVRAPFLDRDLVAHLGRAPARWRLQQHAYKRMISTAFPHAAAVPWTHSGSRYAARAADFAAQARGYIGRHLRRLGRGDERRRFAICADTRNDRLLAQVIREFAASSSLPGEIFDRHGIEETVRRHWEGGEDLTHLVSMLATFATAFRLLLWQAPRAMPAEAVPAA